MTVCDINDHHFLMSLTSYEGNVNMDYRTEDRKNFLAVSKMCFGNVELEELIANLWSVLETFFRFTFPHSKIVSAMAGGALSALLLCITINVSKACFSSGICGGGFGCAPPIAPVCVGGCSPGYACGQFGCYSRARARSSKTFGSAITKNKRLQEAAPDTKVLSVSLLIQSQFD